MTKKDADFVTRFRQELVISGYSPRTIEMYLLYVKAFLRFLKKDADKAATSQTPPADKAPDGDSAPAKTTKRSVRKKATRKKVSKKTTASGPVAKPSATAPEKDSKGIYTLKSPPSG